MEDIKTKALKHIQRGAWSKQKPPYRVLLERSDDPDVAVNLGAHCSANKEGFVKVAHIITAAAQQWPLDRNLLLNACNCWRETGEIAVALRHLRNALKQGLMDTELEEALAETLALAGETEEAIQRYESIVNTDPVRTQSWLGLGIVYARIGQHKESAFCYKKVISINPNESRATANLITIYKRTGEFQSAQEVINNLSEEKIQDQNIKKAIADLRIAEGDSVTASHYLAQLAASNPEEAANWLNWATCLKSLKFTVPTPNF